MMVTFTERSVSVTMQNCETSAPVPDVLGIISSGGIGFSTRSTPAKSRMSPALPAMIATPLAASITEPPPIATRTSASSAT